MVNFFCSSVQRNVEEGSVETYKRGNFRDKHKHLTVGLLIPRAGARAAKLLGLASPGVGDKEGPVVLDENVLNGPLAGLVNKLLVICHDALGNGLADRVDLRRGSAPLDANADIHSRELVSAHQQHGLKRLELQDLGLQKGDGDTIYLDKARTLLNKRQRRGGFLVFVGGKKDSEEGKSKLQGRGKVDAVIQREVWGCCTRRGSR